MAALAGCCAGKRLAPEDGADHKEPLVVGGNEVESLDALDENTAQQLQVSERQQHHARRRKKEQSRRTQRGGSLEELIHRRPHAISPLQSMGS